MCTPGCHAVSYRMAPMSMLRFGARLMFRVSRLCTVLLVRPFPDVVSRRKREVPPHITRSHSRQVVVCVLPNATAHGLLVYQ